MGTGRKKFFGYRWVPGTGRKKIFGYRGVPGTGKIFTYADPWFRRYIKEVYNIEFLNKYNKIKSIKVTRTSYATKTAES